jgi:hypothetical protein
MIGGSRVLISCAFRHGALHGVIRTQNHLSITMYSDTEQQFCRLSAHTTTRKRFAVDGWPNGLAGNLKSF